MVNSGKQKIRERNQKKNIALFKKGKKNIYTTIWIVYSLCYFTFKISVVPR